MITIDDLIEKVQGSSKKNTKNIRKAYQFAEKAHAGQTRMSGVSYISHPLAVADLLADYHADEESIVAALLHDVIEDTKYSKKQIEKEFGSSIALMVDSLTKLPHTYSQHPSRFHEFDFKIESIRKIFDVMQRDVRVMVIKLCDRLHNMQTLHHFRPHKQQRIAQETLDVFVKIADRLCMYDLKEKLEKLAFRFLYPEQFEKYEQLLVNHVGRLQRDQSQILEALKDTPHISSKRDIRFVARVPYEKLILTQFDQQEILTEVFLIVKDKDACYQALQDIHGIWKHMRGQFRDYISSPKSNGYQALETTLLTNDRSEIHFVILSSEMYEYYRNGASIEAFRPSKNGRKVHLPWIDYLKQIHLQTKSESEDYMLALQSDILTGSISVYGEDGKMLFLPPRSTVLDAAFYALGMKAQFLTKAWVNDVSRDFSNYLRENDKCTFSLSSWPTITWEWLDMVNTSYGRSQIYEIFQALPLSDRIEYGHNILQKEVHKRGLGYIEEIEIKSLEILNRELTLHTLEDLYVKIAEGEVSVDKVCNVLYSAKECNPHLLREYDLEIEFSSDKPKSLLNFIAIFDSPDYHIESLKVYSSEYNGPIVKGTVTFCPQNFDAFDKVLHGVFDVRAVSLKEKRLKVITRWIVLLFILLASLDPIVAYSLLNKYEIHSENLVSMRFITIFFTMIFLVWFKGFSTKEIKEARIHYRRWDFLLSVLSFFLTAYFSYHALEMMVSPFAYQLTIYIILLPFFSLYREKYARVPTALFLVFCFSLFAGYLYYLRMFIGFDVTMILYALAASVSFTAYTHFSTVFQKNEHIHRRSLTFFRNLSFLGAIMSIVPYFFDTQSHIPTFHDILLGTTYSLLFIVVPYVLYFIISGIYSYTSSIWKQFIVALLVVKMGEWLLLGFPLRPIELIIGFSLILGYWIFSGSLKKTTLQNNEI